MTDAASASGSARIWARLTLAGVLLYAVLDIVVQLLPPHYSPIRQAESDLGVGPYGWIMSVAFVVRGLLTACAVISIARAVPASAARNTGLTLLGAWAVCSALLAFFPTDILDGGHRFAATGPTLHGRLHLLFAFIAFICAVIGALVLSRVAPFPGGLWIAIAAAVALILLVPADGAHIGGLLERIFLLLILIWLVLATAAHARAGRSFRGARRS